MREFPARCFKLELFMTNSSISNSVVLVGCGWLGTPLAKVLAERGYVVLATRSNPERVRDLKARGVDTIALALNPDFACAEKERLKGISNALIMLPPGIRKGGGECFVQRIENLLAALDEAGVRRVILTSSTSIYPEINREVDETHELTLDTSGARILNAAENAVLKYPGIDGIVVRLAGLCGPGREPGRLLAGKVNVPGGNHPVNLIHQQDAVEILFCVLRRARGGQIFNACAPGHPLKQDLYPRAAQALGLSPPVFRHSDQGFKIVRADKVCSQLGFVYEHPEPSDWWW